MDGNQDFVAFTVDPDRVVVVLVGREQISLVLGGTGWSELNVDVLAHACRYHALFLVTDFEVRGLWRQNVQPLGRWRVIYDTNF